MNQASTHTPQPLPWQRGVAWLLFLGPFFFLSYGLSNTLAAQRAIDASVVFAWEQHIPFVPWTIVPYWSIDLLYALSFLCCRNRAAIDRHGLRLLSAQILCVSCFLLFPLHFSFERPPTAGLFGALFDALTGFDQPYNQAPSLHIALLVILWVRFYEVAQGIWRIVVNLWAALIAVSVLTTFQHHFLDVPTGAALGLLCLWLWPDGARSPLQARPLDPESQAPRHRLAKTYALGALLLAGIALYCRGWALWLFWGVVALSCVAVIYARIGATGFQKSQGRLSLPVRWLLAPYLLGAWLNSRAWTWRSPHPSAITPEVWLGRMPTQAEMQAGGFSALFEVAAELPAPASPAPCAPFTATSRPWAYDHLPWLDMVPPTAAQLAEAAYRIEALRTRSQQGRLLVSCALGYSRSACAVAAWLLHTHQVPDAEAAVQRVQQCRPQVRLKEAHRKALREFARSCHRI